MQNLDLNLVLKASPEDIEAITEASRDYIEGWYNADPERMARCLHPDLVKRTVGLDSADGTWRLRRDISAQMLVGYTSFHCDLNQEGVFNPRIV